MCSVVTRRLHSGNALTRPFHLSYSLIVAIHATTTRYLMFKSIREGCTRDMRELRMTRRIILESNTGRHPISNHRARPCLMLLNTTHHVVATWMGVLEKLGCRNGRVRAFPVWYRCWTLRIVSLLRVLLQLRNLIDEMSWLGISLESVYLHNCLITQR